MKPEIKITKCYLVECVINNTRTYYVSEHVFGDRQEANEVAKKLKAEAEEWLQEQGIGEWEERNVFGIKEATIDDMQSARCSRCKKYLTTPYLYSFTDFKFYPSCGAFMGGKESKNEGR